jgi:signal transduction histidine kinase
VEAASSEREYYPIRGIDVLAIVTFWALLAVVSGVSRELDPRIPGLPARVVSAAVMATYIEYGIWALLTVPIWWMSSRYAIEEGRRLGRILLFVAVGVVLAILVDALHLRIRQELISELVEGRFRRRPPPTLFVGLGFLDDLMVYFAVLGAGVARDYFLRYQARLEETARLQALLTQARLDALRSQLNPHFLFNTLNAVSALVERDPRGVRRMIARLSNLLRYTLEESAEQEVPLTRELDLLSEYVELMQIRFQGKLNVAMHVDDSARGALVPSLILQPLVENAIKHGTSHLTGGAIGEIAIHAQRAGDALRVSVVDNGPGRASAVASDGTGLGLSNTTARLRQMYGPASEVTLRARPEGGTIAEIVMPFRQSARPGPM